MSRSTARRRARFHRAVSRMESCKAISLGSGNRLEEQEGDLELFMQNLYVTSSFGALEGSLFFFGTFCICFWLHESVSVGLVNTSGAISAHPPKRGSALLCRLSARNVKKVAVYRMVNDPFPRSQHPKKIMWFGVASRVCTCPKMPVIKARFLYNKK